MLADFGVAEVRRKEAMFSHYDQFVVNGKSALENHSVFLKLANAVPAQRLVQALLDARVAYREMEQEWQDAEADREARQAVRMRPPNSRPARRIAKPASRLYTSRRIALEEREGLRAVKRQ
jgi:hypothetical protein